MALYHGIQLHCSPELFFITGPSRQELKYMAEYKKQAESQSSPDQQQQQPQQQPPQQQQQQQSSASSQSSMGMMRMPGSRGPRKGKGKYLDLGAGGLTDTTFEAAVLGELAVISLDPPEVRSGGKGHLLCGLIGVLYVGSIRNWGVSVCVCACCVLW